jgi:hypothetical protein
MAQAVSFFLSMSCPCLNSAVSVVPMRCRPRSSGKPGDQCQRAGRDFGAPDGDVSDQEHPAKVMTLHHCRATQLPALQ